MKSGRQVSSRFQQSSAADIELMEDFPIHTSDMTHSALRIEKKVQTAKKGKSVKVLPPSPPEERHIHVVPNAHILLIMPYAVDISKLPDDYPSTIAQARNEVCRRCQALGIDCHQTTKPTWGCLECADNGLDDCSWVISQHHYTEPFSSC